jgi:hypothetical protein
MHAMRHIEATWLMPAGLGEYGDLLPSRGAGPVIASARVRLQLAR